MIDGYDLLLNITMILISILFMAFTIISYIMEPSKIALLAIIGTIMMLITSIWILSKTIRA